MGPCRASGLSRPGRKEHLHDLSAYPVGGESWGKNGYCFKILVHCFYPHFSTYFNWDWELATGLGLGGWLFQCPGVSLSSHQEFVQGCSLLIREPGKGDTLFIYLYTKSFQFRRAKVNCDATKLSLPQHKSGETALDFFFIIIKTLGINFC